MGPGYLSEIFRVLKKNGATRFVLAERDRMAGGQPVGGVSVTEGS
jgi:ubiquinone/menaquinone biosynthesis C-methylase UbiE